MRPATFLMTASLAALPALAQILPPNAKEPVEVRQPTGEFAKKLHGQVMPIGRGWKAVTDREKRFQIMIPGKWKVEEDASGETALRVVPPSQGKVRSAVLVVTLTPPKDDDPLEVQEKFALSYAGELAEEPQLKQYQFKPTDSGFVVARGMKFALAGGSMQYGKTDHFQQQQLVYIAEDRVVTIQFAARQEEFVKHGDDVARIFASYQNLGVKRTVE